MKGVAQVHFKQPRPGDPANRGHGDTIMPYDLRQKFFIVEGPHASTYAIGPYYKCTYATPSLPRNKNPHMDAIGRPANNSLWGTFATYIHG